MEVIMMSPFDICQITEDEQRLRTLFLNVYRRIAITIIQRTDGERPDVSTADTIKDAALLQIINKVYDQKPNWRKRRDDDVPLAKLIEATVKRRNSSASSQPSSSSTSRELFTSQSNRPSVSPAACRPYSRQFLCSICGKTFGRERVLLNHEKTHAEESPYKCSVCDRSFAHANQLHVHARLHVGEPFGPTRDHHHRRRTTAPATTSAVTLSTATIPSVPVMPVTSFATTTTTTTTSLVTATNVKSITVVSWSSKTHDGFPRPYRRPTEWWFQSPEPTESMDLFLPHHDHSL